MRTAIWVGVAGLACFACSGTKASAPVDGGGPEGRGSGDADVVAGASGHDAGADVSAVVPQDGNGDAAPAPAPPPVNADVRHRTGAPKLTRGPRAWPQFAYSAANVSSNEARVSDAPTLAWTAELSATGPFAYASPVVGDGRVFVTLYGGGIAALDARTGKVVWHNKAVKGNKYGTPAYADGRLFASVLSKSGGTDVVALDAVNGDELWRSAGGSWGALKVAGGALFVSRYADGGNTVVALDPTTGAERWRRPTTCKGDMGVSGDRLYCAGERLTALDVPTGAVVYEVASGDSHFMSTPAISGDLIVVVGDALHAYATADGHAVWSAPFAAANRPINGGSWYETSPAIADGLVVVIGTDGVSAYALANGAKRWTAPADWPGTTASIADGLVLVGPALLDLQTGGLVWRDQDRRVWPTAALIDGGFFFVEIGGYHAYGYAGPVAGESVE